MFSSPCRVVLSVLLALLQVSPSLALQCRSLPSDPSWPSDNAWNKLNHTVGGRLIRTVPLASPCHDPNFDEDACNALKAAWPFSQTYIPSPSDFTAPLAQQAACDPFTPRETPCEMGNYPIYAINASCADDVAAGIKFAQEQNVRLIIKSTGHDLLGKSSGRGSLSIWMHSFTDISFTKTYNGSNAFENYHGPAARIEPGLLTYQIYEAAATQGLRIVGGTCNTVAVGGGYTQGGGHSLLSTIYGLSADNVLEWEVVTADGSHIIATPTQHADLYWALSGGGPGTWCVVLSITVRAYPDGIISGAALAFTLATSPSEDVFWQGVEAIHQFFPEYYDQGAAIPYTIIAGTFFLQPLTLPDKTKEDATNLISGYTAILDGLKIPYSLNVTEHSNFLDFFATYYGPLPFGVFTDTEVQGSRLMPEEVILQNTTALIEVYKNIVAQPQGFLIVGNGINVSKGPRAAPSNSVLPAWRKSYLHMFIVSQWDWNSTLSINSNREQTFLDTIIPEMTELAPISGVYMNEGNPKQPNWQQEFYGSNYKLLKTVKNRHDPNGIFYTTTGVGSDDWIFDQEGRLCRK